MKLRPGVENDTRRKKKSNINNNNNAFTMIRVIKEIPGRGKKEENMRRKRECFLSLYLSLSPLSCNLHVLIALKCTLFFAFRRNCEQTERLIDFKCAWNKILFRIYSICQNEMEWNFMARPSFLFHFILFELSFFFAAMIHLTTY